MLDVCLQICGEVGLMEAADGTDLWAREWEPGRGQGGEGQWEEKGRRDRAGEREEAMDTQTAAIPT